MLDSVQDYILEVIRNLLEIKEKGVQRAGKGKGPVVARTTASVTCLLNLPQTEISDADNPSLLTVTNLLNTLLNIYHGMQLYQDPYLQD